MCVCVQSLVYMPDIVCGLCVCAGYCVWFVCMGLILRVVMCMYLILRVVMCMCLILRVVCVYVPDIVCGLCVCA